MKTTPVMGRRLRLSVICILLLGQLLWVYSTVSAQSAAYEIFGTPSGCKLNAEGEGQDRTATLLTLLHGIGVMGDSFYDEYQGTDNRGGKYHHVSFNLIELLQKYRGLNFGPWGSWGEPRREGYKYNWARSGATSTTMIEMGQHTGLAEQVRSGEVTFVLIGIGANDFSPYYLDSYDRIYKGTMSDRELAAKVDGAIKNVTLAVDTVQQAGAKGIAVTLFTQWELDPQLKKIYPDDKKRQRIADAIAAVNHGISTMAASRGIALIDQNSIGKELLPKLDKNGRLNVNGEMIDFLHNGDEPHHSRLGDGEHAGTIMSGLIANRYLIDTLNNQYCTSIPPFSEAEMVEFSKGAIGLWDQIKTWIADHN